VKLKVCDQFDRSGLNTMRTSGLHAPNLGLTSLFGALYVVEHPLGKGEVESSILSGSTSKSIACETRPGRVPDQDRQKSGFVKEILSPD